MNTFQEQAHRNTELYSRIAIAQALFRNFFSSLEHSNWLTETLDKEYSDDTPDFRFETFLSDLVRAVERFDAQPVDIAKYPRRFQTKYYYLSIFSQYLEKNGLRLEEFIPYLRSLNERGGIIVAFNELGFNKYEVVTSDGSIIDDKNEVVLRVPSKRLELETVMGFEPLGEFEDRILDKISL